MFEPCSRSWITDGPAVFFLAWPKSGASGAPTVFRPEAFGNSTFAQRATVSQFEIRV